MTVVTIVLLTIGLVLRYAAPDKVGEFDVRIATGVLLWMAVFVSVVQLAFTVALWRVS
jgi:hypothetical protein